MVGGYGILAIPTKSAEQSWQSGYGRDAIPSYRLPLIYKDKDEHILKQISSSTRQLVSRLLVNSYLVHSYLIYNKHYLFFK